MASDSQHKTHDSQRATHPAQCGVGLQANGVVAGRLLWARMAGISAESRQIREAALPELPHNPRFIGLARSRPGRGVEPGEPSQRMAGPNARVDVIYPRMDLRNRPEHVWRAPVSSRSNGAECPECRVVGKSRVELDHHAAAVELFGNARSGVIMRDEAFTTRKSWATDISVNVNGYTVVIEYDGVYWHSAAAKLLVDERKSLDLLAADGLWCGCGKMTFHRSPSTIPGIGKYRCTPRFRGRAPSWRRFATG